MNYFNLIYTIIMILEPKCTKRESFRVFPSTTGEYKTHNLHFQAEKINLIEPSECFLHLGNTQNILIG